MMFTRYVSAISMGTFMTIGLLYIMQGLISMQPTVYSDPRPRFTLGRMNLPDPLPPPERREWIDPEKLTRSPVPPTRLTPRVGGPGIGVKIPEQKAPGGPYRPSMQKYADGPLVAMIRVSPSYPPIASARGLEGYVVVQFDVMANGLVSNVIVLESSHSAFERNAIKAAERFKFKPRVVDGEPQVSRNIQNRFTFTLHDEDSGG